MSIESIFHMQLKLFRLVLYRYIKVFEELGSYVIEDTLIIWKLQSLNNMKRRLLEVYKLS